MDPKNRKMISWADNPYSLFEGIAGTVWFFDYLKRLLNGEKGIEQKVNFPAFDYPTFH